MDQSKWFSNTEQEIKQERIKTKNYLSLYQKQIFRHRKIKNRCLYDRDIFSRGWEGGI